MNKKLLLLYSTIYFLGFSSFIVVKNDLVGKWNWVHIINLESREKLRIEEVSMGMADKITTEFKEDDSYQESKMSTKDKKVSTTKGTWKIEAEGTVLSLKPADKWLPTKIMSLSGDTMVIQMSPTMHLVLAKEK